MSDIHTPQSNWYIQCKYGSQVQISEALYTEPESNFDGWLTKIIRQLTQNLGREVKKPNETVN